MKKSQKKPEGLDRDLVSIGHDEPSPAVRAMIASIRTEVIGQDSAVELAAEGLEIDEAELYERGDLAGVLFCIGPPGSGKTTLAEAVAHAWIGKLDRSYEGMLLEPVNRIDCTQYTTRWEVSNLIGAAKGTVGYDDDTPLRQHRLDRYYHEVELRKHMNWLKDDKSKRRLRLTDPTPDEINEIWEYLTDAVEAPAKKVLLFDEIERGHRTLFNLLISLMNGKPLEMTNGTFSDLTRTFLDITSNLNERLFTGEQGIGFGRKKIYELDSDVYRDVMLSATMRELKKRFPPAFVSRVKESIAIFHPLTEAQFADILDLKLARIERLFERVYQHRLNEIAFAFTPEFKKMLLKEGIDPIYGARRLEKTVRRLVLKRLARVLNWQKLAPGVTKVEHGDTIVFDIAHGKVETYVQR